MRAIGKTVLIVILILILGEIIREHMARRRRVTSRVLQKNLRPNPPSICLMQLCSFEVGRFVIEDRKYSSYGHFVIDSPFNRQDEILDSLSDSDMKKIDVKLDIIHDLRDEMPPYIQYTLIHLAANPMDLLTTPNLISDSGYKIWVTPKSRTVRL
jgi:hypothetical protein